MPPRAIRIPDPIPADELLETIQEYVNVGNGKVLNFGGDGYDRKWSGPLFVNKNNKKVTLKGLRVKLVNNPENRGRELLVIEGEGCVVNDFELTGNADEKYRKKKNDKTHHGATSLVVVLASKARVSNGVVKQVAGNGIHVLASEYEFTSAQKDRHGRDVKITVPGGNREDIAIATIEGKNVGRDVVSVEGDAAEGREQFYVKDCNVFNIDCIRDKDVGFPTWERGGVEFSDGCRDCHVAKVFAQRTEYALDIQDHGCDNKNLLPLNKNITAYDLTAIDCEHAIRGGSGVDDKLFNVDDNEGPSSKIFIKKVISTDCSTPVKVKNWHRVEISGLDITDSDGKKKLRLEFEHCSVVDVSGTVKAKGEALVDLGDQHIETNDNKSKKKSENIVARRKVSIDRDNWPKRRKLFKPK